MDELTMFADLCPRESALDAVDLGSLRADLFPNEPTPLGVGRLQVDVGEPSFALEPARSEAPRRRVGRRVLLGVAASALLLAGVLGVVVVNRETSAPSVPLLDSVVAIDPVGALFVLPDPIDAYQLAGGDLSTSFPDGNIETFAPNGMLLGVADGTGYNELRTVSVYDESPTGYGTWSQVETTTGPAFVSAQGFTTLAQQRGDRWLVITTPVDEQLALDLLDAVTVDTGGAIAVDSSAAGVVVVDQLSVVTDSVIYSTSFEITGADGSLITVETGTYPTPLFPLGSVADRIEPTQIDGVQAWLATRADADGEWAGMVWSETPNRIVAISGHNTSVSEITRLAESLGVVDEAAWRRALPDATID